MAFYFKWLFRIVIGCLVIAFSFGYLAYYLGTRSLPDYNATFTTQGISGPIEIARDTANVPHIFASTDEDVFYGIGFAHAQDRLFQMMLMRRTAQGKLSELFGERTKNTDALMRSLAIYEAAEASAAAQTPDTRAALDAYARGVNAWIGEINKGAMGRGAPEFFLFPSEIAYWRAEDSIALLKLVALRQSDHIPTEVLRARTSLLLPTERLRDLLPDAPGAASTVLKDYAELLPAAAPSLLPHQADSGADYAMLGFQSAPLGGASNVWAAAPARSASGASLMANDPHLSFTAPGAWYLAHLELGTGGVIGATVPGIPFVIAGRKDTLSWGITSAYTDDADLYIEQLNPDDRTEVMTPNGYQKMRTKSSIIRIKDAAPETVILNWTENGPVLPQSAFNLNTVTPTGYVMSVAWTTLAPDDTSMSALHTLMRANSVAEGIQAGSDFVTPALNLTLADRDRVAQKTIGRSPLRDVAHQSQGRIPSQGWVAENRWQGARSYASLPLATPDRSGIVGNTNNKTTDEAFPNHLSYHWGDTQRIERWKRLMQNREVHTRESFIEAQNDIVSYSARALLPLVAADLWFTGDAAPEGTPERQRQRALALLAEWNGEMNEHLPEPLIYSAWMRALQDRLIRDDLGPLARQYTHVEPLFIERVFRNIGGASVWCDVLQSAATETCADVARQSLDDALLSVGETYGTALESLRWGDAHTAEHKHPVLGDIPFLKWVVNIRQSTSGGDNTLMRGVTSGKAEAPFANVHGAAYRGVYDFADPDSSVFVTATGQSGHPLSRHYDDLGELWRRGEYVPMTLDPTLARAAGVGITKILPEQ
jgi:penicillin amidase